MVIYKSLLCCFFLTWPCLNALAQDEMPVQLLQRVQTSLVQVRAIDSKTFDEGNGQEKTATLHSQGLGVILDSYGLIVTNTHIIKGFSQILVGLSDGKILAAKLVYSSDADFSFIKIDPPYPLDPITWADSSAVQPGTAIIALSNDDSDQEHVVGGTITNVENGVDSNNVELLELDLTLYHGDSGGPILDTEGHLLGMIMAKNNNEDNKSYAIASNKIQQEYQQYQQNLPS